MMESLRAWLLSLAGVALLTALASLFPDVGEACGASRSWSAALP